MLSRRRMLCVWTPLCRRSEVILDRASRRASFDEVAFYVHYLRELWQQVELQRKHATTALVITILQHSKAGKRRRHAMLLVAEDIYYLLSETQVFEKSFQFKIHK